MVTLLSALETRTFNAVSVTIGMPKRITRDRAAISIQQVAKSLNVSTITTVPKGSCLYRSLRWPVVQHYIPSGFLTTPSIAL